jgi:hypothetical protein
MDTHWWLSEGFGPRATGTPGYQAAADWAMKKFNEWGLKNVHVERFPFGQGWSIESLLGSPADAATRGARRPAALVFAVDERPRHVGRRIREGRDGSRTCEV